MLDASINRPNTYNISGATKQAAEQIPAFQFSVLTCKPSLLATKIIYPIGEPKPYDNARQFLFDYKEVDCLEDFAKLALPWLAKESKCFIIRGQLKPGLVGWQRRLWKPDPKNGDPATIECLPRRWIPLDLDGVEVPHGLGAPDKLAEAGYHIRDHYLPSYFRGARCVAAATSSTGRKGPCTAHLRLFFVLNEAADNDVLRAWIDDLSAKYIAIDPKVMEAQQPIYTARPWFRGCDDPVPIWSRVRLLDGFEDAVTLELPRRSKVKKHAPQTVHVCNEPLPDWLLEAAKQDAGFGIAPDEPATEISTKAWGSIRQIFDLLDGCPKNGKGRHDSLNRAAWWLAKLYSEGELPKRKAFRVFFKAAEGINNSDGKYDVHLLKRHIRDAFADIGR